MRHKKLLTLHILNELMYDFDKKSKQNIQAIYYIVSTFARETSRSLKIQRLVCTFCVQEFFRRSTFNRFADSFAIGTAV